MVAGQMAGALVVDLIAPAPGEAVTAATVIGVVLTMVAVAISGRSQPGARGPLPLTAMRPAPVPTQPWPLARRWFEGLAELAESLRAPRGSSDELEEARELLAYWEQRARRLPRWALTRRREAHEMACRWRERVGHAEQLRYGRGLMGAATQLAVERRLPATLAHRGRQAARPGASTRRRP